jgi:CheY-like chemotaxis protein
MHISIRQETGNPFHAVVPKPRKTARRILLIDDDTMIAMLLSEMLEEMGHHVGVTAATEAEAVTTAATYKPDLMIVDACLANGSGIGAVDQILKSGFIPHLFISGNIAKVRALRPDAVLLEKPFEERALMRAIASALDVTAG